MNLRQAIHEVLRRNGGGPMATRAIADEIAAAGLYVRGDGDAAQATQVAARANRHRDDFERVPPGIRLRKQTGDTYATKTPASVSATRRRVTAESPRGFSDLTENDVVDAVCRYLERDGYRIESRAQTTQRGVDVLAVHVPDGAELRVEAKGATSSKHGTNRHGKPFNASQVLTHVSRAFFSAASAPRGADAHSAIALPRTPLHQRFADRIDVARRELDIDVFWVDAGGEVDLSRCEQ